MLRGQVVLLGDGALMKIEVLSDGFSTLFLKKLVKLFSCAIYSALSFLQHQEGSGHEGVILIESKRT